MDLKLVSTVSKNLILQDYDFLPLRVVRGCIVDFEHPPKSRSPQWFE